MNASDVLHHSDEALARARRLREALEKVLAAVDQLPPRTSLAAAIQRLNQVRALADGSQEFDVLAEAVDGAVEYEEDALLDLAIEAIREGVFSGWLTLGLADSDMRTEEAIWWALARAGLAVWSDEDRHFWSLTDAGKALDLDPLFDGWEVDA